MSTIENYGRFDDDKGCFELTAEPPRKWLNVHFNKIGDLELYSEVSNLGDGPITVRDREGRTVSLVSWDAKYLYVRDEESGKVFCPWGAPAPAEVENQSCRYFAAKTEISSTHDGLHVTQRVFVPQDLAAEIHTLFIDNNTDRPRKISVFAYAMFQLTGCDHEGRWVGKDNYAVVHPEINGVFVSNRNTFCPTKLYNGYLITLDNYRGGSGYRDNFTRSEFSLGTPKILWGWDADNKPGFGPDCAGLVQVTFEIPAKERGRADFLIGQADNVDAVKRILKEMSAQKIDQMCQVQIDAEEKRSTAFQVKTGFPNYDSLMNHFVKKQMYSYLINKSGFRDNLQLDNAFCMVDYKTTEENLLRALSSQYANGSVPHSFRPLNRLQYSDKPAWIMLTVPGLIYESGDLSLLEKKLPYFESSEKGTVWDHMIRAMRYLSSDLGANGLCNQHHADWNDGLEATKEAGERESVMVTQQLAYGLLQVEKLATKTSRSEIAAEARQLYDTFNKKLNEICWDGEWYVRTICGDGYRIGSNKNAEGKIFVNTQSWAIISQTASEARAKQCMGNVDKYIRTDLGYRICHPAFSHYDPRVGRMSNSIPGHVENGGCYCHAAGFKGVADCLMGRAEEAWETFIKTAPDNPLNPVSQSRMEPFSFTNSFSSVDMVYGRSGYPWRTGTAAWFTVLLVEYILGARRSMEGLLIDPCLTKTIPHAKILRRFRGACYDISIDNTSGASRGVSNIILDGQPFTGTVLPVFKNGTHTVEVTLG